MGKRGIHCHRDLGSPTFRVRRKYPPISTPASPLYCTGTRASSTPAHRHATPKRYRPTHRPSRRCPIHLNVSRLQGILNRITTTTTCIVRSPRDPTPAHSAIYTPIGTPTYAPTHPPSFHPTHTYIRTNIISPGASHRIPFGAKCEDEPGTVPELLKQYTIAGLQNTCRWYG